MSISQCEQALSSKVGLEGAAGHSLKQVSKKQRPAQPLFVVLWPFLGNDQLV